MLDSRYRFPLLAVLLASAAAAQPQPGSERKLRQRTITLPAKADEAAIRVARGALTTLTFDSALAAKGVQLEGRETHFERVDEDQRLVSFKPRVDLAPGERLLLTVRFGDGAAPQEATFELVAADEAVDASVEVVRRARSAEALQAELRELKAKYEALQDRSGEGGPEGMVLSGWLTQDIRARRFDARVAANNASGLKVEYGVGYRTGKWALVEVRLRSLPGTRRWALGEVKLTSARGAPVKVLSVHMDRPQLSPGEEGLLLVRTEAPWWERDEELLLELKDREGGRPLPLSGVVF
ncbi:DUF2381 family protein [Pyxidicoccus sp. MSG2]|uniref:DUF2381 family protein n=1 Tax=Pyxidicoccus sp. MSG2 TaxID=2996790 RepID=UPI0022716A80|nr:DUF2381 family protein [Pyxidicoccus sp. MSG2]MCY1018257.1 DUF2381 family protein [Pyxidicoccus sp. MSG2]